jgi:hypothetical protein
VKIFFEDYPYSPKDVSFLTDIALIELNEGRIKLPYVGYYYDVASSETIFILPKVFIIENKAFGRYTPGQLLNISEDNKKLTSDDKAFLFNLSAWLYQAISLFNERNMDNEITSQRSLAGVVEHRGEGDATMLDHVLALLLFNKTHQSLFTHIATIMHSGKYKVHWTKTIRTTSPLLKGNKPYYLDCKTKEKTINYDEELICLFYSTLDYLRQSYHFVVKHNLNFETEKPHRIASMIESGKGTRRLRGMRGKYFTDELVQLWHLLYAFYERAEEVVQKKLQSERLLVRNFNIVFEDMIDCLIGDSSIPMELKNQEDGKIVDHIYRDKSLIDGEDLYFIGDSKYYKEGSSIGKNSRYKQFTYARNVIQYNIDLFNRKEEGEVLRYRDELTEGYNPTPNFFIRGVVNPNSLSYHDSQLRQDEKGRYYNYHFENRLFDRDTLLVLTYDINFLYVLSSYVQSCGYSTSVDRFLRGKFRQDVLEAYQKEYDFYEMKPINLSNEEFVECNFKKLIGKIYQTKDGKLILALRSSDGHNNSQLLNNLSSQVLLTKVSLVH